MRINEKGEKIMIKKSASFNTDLRENMRGGDGVIEVTNFITEEELNNKGRLFGKLVIKPACGIGYHVHEHDAELFYVVKGCAVYSDNGEEKTLCAGDLAICPCGTGHSIKNEGTEDVELIALIVFE